MGFTTDSRILEEHRDDRRRRLEARDDGRGSRRDGGGQEGRVELFHRVEGALQEGGHGLDRLDRPAVVAHPEEGARPSGPPGGRGGELGRCRHQVGACLDHLRRGEDCVQRAELLRGERGEPGLERGRVGRPELGHPVAHPGRGGRLAGALELDREDPVEHRPHVGEQRIRLRGEGAGLVPRRPRRRIDERVDDERKRGRAHPRERHRDLDRLAHAARHEDGEGAGRGGDDGRRHRALRGAGEGHRERGGIGPEAGSGDDHPGAERAVRGRHAGERMGRDDRGRRGRLGLGGRGPGAARGQEEQHERQAPRASVVETGRRGSLLDDGTLGHGSPPVRRKT